MKNLCLFLLFSFASFSLKADATEDLFNAIYKAELPKIKEAISAGADVNALHKNGFTPLLLSMWYPEITAELIKAKANVNQATHNNTYTPLIYACMFGSFETIIQLVDAGANINGVTLSGTTPYLAAVPLYRLPVLKYLEEKGADIKAINGFNQDALMILASSPKTAASIAATYKTMADNVAKNGNPVPPMIKRLQDETLYSNANEMIDYLAGKGFDLNKQTDVKVPDNTPDAEKTNKNLKKQGIHQSAVSIGLKAGNSDIINTFLAKGGNVAILKDKYPLGYEVKRFSNIFTPSTITDADALFVAVKAGNKDLLKILLDKGVGDVKQKYKGFVSPCTPGTLFNIEGFTLLMLAANQGNLEICELLVAQGAKGMDKCTLNIVGSRAGKEIACGEYLTKKALSYPEDFATTDEVKAYLKTLKR